LSVKSINPAVAISSLVAGGALPIALAFFLFSNIIGDSAHVLIGSARQGKKVSKKKERQSPPLESTQLVKDESSENNISTTTKYKAGFKASISKFSIRLHRK
jgi:hypothetical protein